MTIQKYTIIIHIYIYILKNITRYIYIQTYARARFSSSVFTNSRVLSSNAKKLRRQRDVMLERGFAATETSNIAAFATFCFNAASPIRCASSSRHSPWNFDTTRCVDSNRCDVELIDPTRCVDPTRCGHPNSNRWKAELVDPTR